MKKTFTLFIVMLMVGVMTLSAFEKGTKGVGGSISFYSEKNSSSAITLGPELNYFVLNNLCLDLSLGYSHSWRNEDTSHSSDSWNIGFGARYFFFKRFYGGAGLFYHSFKNNYTDGKSRETELRLSAGYLFSLAKNVYLDLGVAYIKGIGDVHAEAPYYYNSYGTTSISYKNKTSIFRSVIGISVFFK
jgi:hypothetical protein